MNSSSGSNSETDAIYKIGYDLRVTDAAALDEVLRVFATVELLSSFI